MILIVIEVVLFTLLCFSTGVLYEDLRREEVKEDEVDK